MKIATVIKKPTLKEIRENRTLSFLWNLPIGQKIRINDADLKVAKAKGFVSLPAKPKTSTAGED